MDCVLSCSLDPVVPRVITVPGPGVSMKPTLTRGGVLSYLYITNKISSIQGKSNSISGFKLVSWRTRLVAESSVRAFLSLVGREVLETNAGLRA